MLVGVAALDDLRDSFREFTHERGWSQFHDPKSLLLALVGEVGELAELYQWIPSDEAAQRARTDPLKMRTAEELADVLIYLVGLADILDVDLMSAATAKLEAAKTRFPVTEHFGNAPDKSRT
jgi:NTP pyrophosphatase (non-canonical NTP hydrolase)